MHLSACRKLRQAANRAMKIPMEAGLKSPMPASAARRAPYFPPCFLCQATRANWMKTNSRRGRFRFGVKSVAGYFTQTMSVFIGDQTRQIAASKAAARGKGPWKKVCHVCKQYFLESEEEEHRESCIPKDYNIPKTFAQIQAEKKRSSSPVALKNDTPRKKRNLQAHQMRAMKAVKKRRGHAR